MKPKARPPQSELFGAHLSELLNHKHPLYVLAERIDWSRVRRGHRRLLRRRAWPARGEHAADGRPAVFEARLRRERRIGGGPLGGEPVLAVLLRLCYMQHELPIDPSSLSKWRKRVGAERLEKLLEATIQTALAMKALRPQELQQVNVDTTVQEKAIAFPTDARLYHKMRVALVRRANRWASRCGRTIASRASGSCQARPLCPRPADEASGEDDPPTQDDLGPGDARHRA